MSEKYNAAMDKITVSDELRKKIIERAENSKEKPKKPKPNISYLRYCAACAACLLMCFAAISTEKDIAPNLPKPNFTKAENTSSDNTANAPENNAKSDEAPNKSDSVQIKKSSGSEKTAPIGKSAERSDNTKAEGTIGEPSSIVKNDPPAPVPPKQSDGNKTEIPVESGGGNILPDGGNDMPTMTPNPNGDDELVMAPNPNTGEMSIDEIRDELGYDFKIPQYVPDGYSEKSAVLMFGETVRITYENGDDTLMYRTAKTDEDISGDCNVYDVCETENINSNEVTLKGDGKTVYTAVWSEDESAYSLNSQKGLSKDTFIEIIKNTDYTENTSQE